MSEQDKKRVATAIEYIESKIANLIQGVKCEHIYDPTRMAYKFDVFLPEKNLPVVVIRFSRENMEDFSSDNTNYGIRFRYYIDFKVYIELIKSGLISSFKISEIFIKEVKDRNREDWWSDRYVRVAFDNKITAVFAFGLEKLKEAMEQTFKENIVDVSSLSELKEDLDRINNILDYYNVHKSLDETSASITSLSILKAAAIYAIVEKERKRDNNRPYLTSKINEEICSIAAFLREGAFLEVRPPEWLGDYVAV
ncbi:MAG: hypothetical protein WC412_06030 [Candidatus Omnitrophota bacterium]|jgi:hypothetical protein